MDTQLREHKKWTNETEIEDEKKVEADKISPVKGHNQN